MSIALVDDDPIIRTLLRTWLSAQGQEDVVELETGREALARARDVSLMCLDLGLGDANGLDVLRALRESSPDLTVIVITANREIETAVRAMQAGAYDYVTKHLDHARFMAAVGRALERVELQHRIRELDRKPARAFGEIVGESPAIRELTGQIERVLDSDINVCVRGESGTGKELVARALHFHGRRRSGPFVAVNCAAIPQSLQESELFGHDRGAFTGAIGTHRGRFEQAHGGTLFLDEIGEMSPMTQASLLRTIQEKTIRRVGGVADVPVDVRLVCATHRDLEAEVRAGRFREDLYFRLVVYPVTIPPLRERKDDIPLLVAHLLDELRKDVGRTITTVTPDALELLLDHDWPGNVRELRNVVHRAMISCSGDVIDRASLPSSLRPQVQRPVLVKTEVDAPVATLQQLEREAIARALAVANGNVTRAAKLLGLGRATLYRRLAERQH